MCRNPKWLFPPAFTCCSAPLRTEELRLLYGSEETENAHMLKEVLNLLSIQLKLHWMPVITLHSRLGWIDTIHHLNYHTHRLQTTSEAFLKYTMSEQLDTYIFLTTEFTHTIKFKPLVMGKGIFFLFVIKTNKDRDVWDELVCETQGRVKEYGREWERERERLRGLNVWQTGRQMDRNLALGNMILPESDP